MKSAGSLAVIKLGKYCENIHKLKVISNRTKENLILSTAMSINLVSLLVLYLL